MTAERKVKTRKENPETPDYSPEGVRRIVEADDVAKALYTIWFDFEVRILTPETTRERKQRLTWWQLSLTPEKDRSFHDPVTTVEVEGREELVGVGMLIRRLALGDAKREISQREAKRIEEERLAREERQAKNKKSKSQKIAERRRKALERRGTNPRDIH